MLDRHATRDDVLAGMTVSLVTIPQCMALAMIAGLRPEIGLYTAIVMELVGGIFSGLPYLNIGPVATMSTMALAVHATVAPGRPDEWPAIAAMLAVTAGLITIIAALLNAGQFIRFVSRSVLLGLLAGAAVLVAGTQVAPLLGVDPSQRATLAAILWDAWARIGQAHLPSILLGAGTLGAIWGMSRIGPRFPAQLAGMALSGAVAWGLERAGIVSGFRSFDGLSRGIPLIPSLPRVAGHGTDLFVGAAAISLVGIIQTMAIGKALAVRKHQAIRPKREILTLGIANCIAGAWHGMPGAGSFGRSGLYAAAGARTRLARLTTPLTTVVIVALAAPLTHYVTYPAIAAVLLTTAWAVVDFKQLREIARGPRHERVVLGTTLLGVFFLPIHWAVILGLGVSIAIFLRRVSRLHLVELVSAAEGEFLEHPVDVETGRTAITMLQIEGPLFFAHAEELADTIRDIAERRPRVIIARMRRTQQIDYSVLSALAEVAREYRAADGTWIICGLNPAMRDLIRESPLGEAIPPERLLQTTRRVFDSAHRAIRMARAIVERGGPGERRMFRVPDVEPRSSAAAEPAEPLRVSPAVR